MYSKKYFNYIRIFIMKYLKNTLVLASVFVALWFSIQSWHAAEEVYNLKSITPTSTQSVEIELNKNVWIKEKDIMSDLKIYQDRAVKDSIKDISNTRMVEVSLIDALTKGDSYSILSISGVEWSIEFTIWNSLDNHEIPNGSLDGEEQGIESILITDPSTIQIVFLQELADEEFDFKIYKDIAVESMTTGSNDSTIDVLLKDSLEDNSAYVWTVTLFEWGADKIDIDSGIYDFTTDTLDKYSAKSVGESLLWELGLTDDMASELMDSEVLGSQTDEESLEATLLAALEGVTQSDNGEELLSWEEEINFELNAAWEDPANRENTQLENLALSSGETPDTGAETWVLVIATFIINTFYFLSRRKRLAQA